MIGNDFQTVKTNQSVYIPDKNASLRQSFHSSEQLKNSFLGPNNEKRICFNYHQPLQQATSYYHK